MPVRNGMEQGNNCLCTFCGGHTTGGAWGCRGECGGFGLAPTHIGCEQGVDFSVWRQQGSGLFLSSRQLLQGKVQVRLTGQTKTTTRGHDATTRKFGVCGHLCQYNAQA